MMITATIVQHVLDNPWVFPLVIVILQALVVLISSARILLKRRYRSEPLSKRLPGRLVALLHCNAHTLYDKCKRWVNERLSRANKQQKESHEADGASATPSAPSGDLSFEPELNADGRYCGPIPVISTIFKPNTSWLLSGMVFASNILLYLLSTLPSLSGKVSTEHLIYLSILSPFLAFYQTVAFWQLDSDLLWHYREIDSTWQRRGRTHKVYLSEALGRIKQSAGMIAERCDNEGEERIRDIRGDAESVAYKEAYTRGLLRVIQTYTDKFYQLDKDPECYERVVEDMYIRIGDQTLAPLARTLCNMNAGRGSGSVEWFPVDYAALVWQSSLALAAATGACPSATSIIDFKQFRKYYENAVNEHPRTAAKRIFIITEAHKWEDELANDLQSLRDPASESAQQLPELQGAGKRVTHFEWIQGVHRAINWEVRFINERRANQIRSHHTNGDLPKYLDFLLVPAKNSWTVRFSCDLIESKPLRNFMLEVPCCPLRIDYICSNDSQKYFEELWNAAFDAKMWLDQNVTSQTLIQDSAYTAMKNGIMTL